MLFNPFSFREIHLRGLVSTGRAATAARVINTGHANASAIAPQWQVIERVTAGQVLLAAGEGNGAQEALRTAVLEGESLRLPHQVQRAVRVAHHGGLDTIAADGHAALQRLRDRLEQPEALSPVGS